MDNMVDARWRAQCAERDAKDERQLGTDGGADAVEFCDNSNFVNEARTAEFAERVRDLGMGEGSETRIDTIVGY